MRSLLLILTTIAFSSLAQNKNGTRSTFSEFDPGSIESEISLVQLLLNNEKGKSHDTIVVSYYLQLAELYSENHDPLSAIVYCDTILTNYKKIDFFLVKEVEVQRAFYQKAAGDVNACLESLLKVLSQYEKRKAFSKSAILNKKIGYTFLKVDDFENAEYHYMQGLQHAKKIGDTETEAYCLMSLGNRFKNENRFDEAEAMYDQSITIAKKYNYKRVLAGNYNNYSTLLRKKGDLNRAMEYIKLAVKMNKETGNDRWLSYNYHNLGNMALDIGNSQQALNYFMLSNQLKEKTGDYRSKIATTYYIADVYFKTQEFKKAYEYMELAYLLKDSIAILDNTALAKKLAAEFQAERREADIVQLKMQDEMNKKDIKIQDEKISYQNFLGWIMGVSILLISIVVLLLWKSVVKRRIINKELKTTNQQVVREKGRSDELLLNILPVKIAEELKDKGHADAQLINQVTVLFTDFKGFTSLAEKLSPKELVSALDRSFSEFDHIMQKYGIEKIKTIGDAYMAAGGLPTPTDTHAMDVVKAALEIRDYMEAEKIKKIASGLPYFEIRIGLHTGPVIAGIVGVKKFQYDIWGDTVNIASRMESSGAVGKVNISHSTYEHLMDDPNLMFENRGKIKAKGKGEMEMYFVRMKMG